MLNLFKHELGSRMWTIFGWGIGLALFGAMYTSIFPEVAERRKELRGKVAAQKFNCVKTGFLYPNGRLCIFLLD